MAKNKFKFTDKTWISFFLDNKKCLGRTCILNNQEVVATIDETGQVGHLPFIEVENPTILNIIKSISKEEKQKNFGIIDDDIIKTMCFVCGEA